MTTDPPREFQCAMCGGIFVAARSQAEAIAEAIANGFDPDDDCVVVCDECYKVIMQAHK